MINNSNNNWRGPFESRMAFETYQDESIRQLVQFAQNPPSLTTIPEQLEHQLWKMGKYMPAALLGLGRYNPAATQLYVYGENSDFSNHDFSTGPYINPGPTILEGEAAYERTLNTWHMINEAPHPHRFDVQSVRETSHDLHAIHWDKKCSIIGYWALDDISGQLSSGGVDIPDTSHVENINSVAWSQSTAGANDGSFSTNSIYYVKPFRESDDPAPDLAEEAVESLAGKAALDALQRYGEVGLYQHLVWSRTLEFLSGVYVGPHIKL